MSLHLCVPYVDNEKICRAIGRHEIVVYILKKTVGLRNRNSSDLNSACFKVLVPVEICQI